MREELCNLIESIIVVIELVIKEDSEASILLDDVKSRLAKLRRIV